MYECARNGSAQSARVAGFESSFRSYFNIFGGSCEFSIELSKLIISLNSRSKIYNNPSVLHFINEVSHRDFD